MKLLVILLLATCITGSVNAQSTNIYKSKPWEEFTLKRLLVDTLSKLKPVPGIKYSAPQQTKNGVYKLPLKGVYLGENGRGDEIYAMTPDNMPCLVPGKQFSSNMPVAGIDKTDKDLLPLLEKDGKKIPEVKLIP